LLQRPETLSKDPVLSFASAIWFWMTPQFPKPSCHDIMVGEWIPTANDTLKRRMPGFGATANVIMEAWNSEVELYLQKLSTVMIITCISVNIQCATGREYQLCKSETLRAIKLF
jgi:hypothetical protein